MKVGRFRLDSWRGGVNFFWDYSVLQIKYPWSKPLFSERYGYRSPNFRLFGFRVSMERRDKAEYMAKYGPLAK